MVLRSSTTIEKFIVSAPFGNHIGFDWMTPTLGTYTAAYRGGRLKQLWRLAYTLRFYPAIGACINRLGLPNEGIDHLIALHREDGLTLNDKIVSISGRDDPSWLYLLTSLHSRVDHLGVVEMNVSCPNCPGEPDTSSYPMLFERAVSKLKLRVSVKLPPIGYEERAEQAIAAGVHYLHCCNTMPTPAGGMSGKPPQPLALQAVRFCRKLDPKIHIIGGMGITGIDDVKRFRDAGANNFAVGSAWFNPFRWPVLCRLARALARGG